MTGPQVNYWENFRPDPFGGPGVQQPGGETAWLENRQQQYRQALQALLQASQPAQQGTALQGSQRAGDLSDVQHGLVTYQGVPDTELLGQARYWGIPNEFASQMPKDELIKLLETLRKENRPEETMAVGFDLAAMFTLGLGQAVTGGLKHLPFVGDNFARIEALQKADEWLNYSEEAVRATIPHRLQWGATAAEVGGQVAAMWYPGTAAWKLAGATGRLIPFAGAITSPLIRAAAQGAATAALLEGGSEHPLAAIGIGAALGPLDPVARAALTRYGPTISALRSRVASAFGGPWEGKVGQLSRLGPDFSAWATGREMDIPFSPQQGPVERLTGQAELERIMRESTDPAEREQAIFFLDQLSKGRAAGTAGMDIPVDARRVQVPGFTPTAVEDLTQQAESMAAQMNKQSIIIESSSLPEAARMVQPNEATVAAAASIDNPGGVNIVPGVPDPGSFMESTKGIPHVRFAQRGNRLDALTSDSPITDEMISQYETHGMFSGQIGYTNDGTAIRILDVSGGMVKAKPLYGQTEFITPVENISPSPVSAGVREVPQAWEQFQRYTDMRMDQVQQSTGGAITPERFDKVRTQNLAKWADDFIADQYPGIPEGEAARLKQYFNERYVDSFRALAPEESALQSQAVAAARAAETATPPTPLARTEALAETKGYQAIPDGQGGWKLVDSISDGLGGGGPPTAIHFDDLSAAEAWLNKLHRPMPDITPPSDVPAEVAEMLPRGAHGEPRLDNDKHDAVVASGAEDLAQAIEAEDPSLAADLRARVEAAKGTGQVRFLQQAWDYGLARWQPMRARMATIERRLIDMGFPEVRPFFHWDNVSTNIAQNHNWMNPHLDKWAQLTDRFDAKDIRSGLVTELFALEDDAARAARATAKGMSSTQIEALQEMNRFFPDVIDDLGIQTQRNVTQEVRQILTHVRTRQFADIAAGKQFEGLVPNEVTSAFLEHLQGAHVDLRELNAQHLGNIFVRGLGFNKFVRANWELASQHVSMIRNVPELSAVGEIMDNWMKLVRHGYDPRGDAILDAMHSVASFFVPGLTKAQVRSVFNGGLTVTHRALLGLRPDVWARDSIQLLLAAPRVGRDLFETIGRYANADQALKEEIWDRGIRQGWIHLGKPRIAQPGAFEDPLIYVQDPQQAGNIGQLVEQPPPSRRYQAVQAVADWLHDVTPDKVRHIQGTWLDPLMIYTKQGERMRLFVGEAGYQRALRAIGKFRTAGVNGDMKLLMGESAARTFEPAVAKKFQDFIASGADDDAAAFIGRQLADATQFRYGIAETAEVARGTMGKIGMQMGNFSQQFYQYAKESIRFGEASDKAKFWAMMGAVTAGLKLAKHATGWNFDKWQFYNSLGFTGGPWMQVAADVQASLAAQSQMAQRQEGPGGQYLTREAGRLNTAARDVAQMFNPVSGGMRTVSNIMAAQESPTPTEATFRALLTGERSAGMDWREQNLQHMQQQPSIDQLQMGSSPVRGASFSMPAVPVQQATPPAEGRMAIPSNNGAPWGAAALSMSRDTLPDRLLYMRALMSGQATQGLDSDDLRFLESLRPLDLETQANSWEMYQNSKVARRGSPAPAGPGSGHQF